METILPKGFVFDSSKVLTPDRMDIKPLHIFIRQYKEGIFQLIIILSILLMASFCWALTRDHLSNVIKFAIVGADCLIGWAVLLIFVELSLTSDYTFAKDCEFHLTQNSNLIVKQYTKTKNTIKGKKSYLDIGNYPQNDHEKKAYPYKVYVKDKIGNKLVYLGKTKNNRVSLDYKSDISKTFVSYCNYINIHHLNDKFVKTLKFERDPHLLDADGLPQYVLKGDGITLKAKPLQTHKYRIYVDKD